MEVFWRENVGILDGNRWKSSTINPRSYFLDWENPTKTSPNWAFQYEKISNFKWWSFHVLTRISISNRQAPRSSSQFYKAHMRFQSSPIGPVLKSPPWGPQLGSPSTAFNAMPLTSNTQPSFAGWIVMHPCIPHGFGGGHLLILAVEAHVLIRKAPVSCCYNHHLDIVESLYNMSVDKYSTKSMILHWSPNHIDALILITWYSNSITPPNQVRLMCSHVFSNTKQSVALNCQRVYPT